jgi:C-lobe and N-lobe beta barrels of Tf-binding protein B
MRHCILTTVFCATLAACGSGSSGSSTVDVASNPNAPLVTEKLGQFAANRTIYASAGTVRGSVDSNGTIKIDATSQDGFGSNVQLNFDKASNSYTLKLNQGGINRTTGPLVASASNTDRDGVFYQYSKGSSDTTEETLSILRWDNTQVNYSYTTLGIWGRTETSGNSAKFEAAYFTGGVPTTATDMPKTGTITYQGLFVGALTNNVDSDGFGGQAVISADFAKGTVGGVFTGTQQLIAANRNFNFTSDARIATGGSVYSGTVTGSTGTAAAGMAGTLNGGFFGPAAAETSGTFTMQGNGLTVGGAFVGKPQ